MRVGVGATADGGSEVSGERPGSCIYHDTVNAISSIAGGGIMVS